MKKLTYLLAFGGLFIEGIVVRDLWNWFIAPSFLIPEITMWTGLGISILVAVIIFRPPWNITKQTDKEKLHRELFSQGVRLMGWGMGFVIHFF